MNKRLPWILLLGMVLILFSPLSAQDYVGDQTCATCHNTVDENTGYNIYTEYKKTGHPYKLNPVNGAAPVYPENTTAGVPNPPEGHTWDEFAYVIGGYGWKARYVKHDGNVFTGDNPDADSTAQYNLETEGWVAYHKGEEKPYNQSCFQCHTTGASTEGSWPEGTEGFGTFAEPGIRCEGCHGPGSEHVSSGAALPNTGDDLKIERCGDCHQRSGRTNNIPASGGYIKHHEQFNEMNASKHRDGNGAELTCASCHDSHIALRYPEAAGEGLSGIKTQCQDCHSDKQILVDGVAKSTDCIDCHMPPASKSAVGMQAGNGWRGDVKTHIMNINTAAVTKDAMFDGSSVALDANGLAAVTLDFVCLRCHTGEDVDWASSYASGIHTNGITTDIDAAEEMPVTFALNQNYPNPFNPTTKISFSLPLSSQVKLSVYSVTGELVATLSDDFMPAGFHNVEFNAGNLTSGVYVYSIQANDFVETKKMILMK